MTGSPSDSCSDSQSASLLNSRSTEKFMPEIPIEIVSEEEMALIEAALVATRSSLAPSAISATCSSSRSSLFSSQFQRNVRSIESITILSKRKFSGCTEPDIEDSGNLKRTQKNNPVTESFLQRYMKNRALSVTDITGTEWCEKQMEFVLLYGRRKKNKAMKAGAARHAKLEEEVVQRVIIDVESAEDVWALKFMNSIHGVHQLLLEGLTRELPVIGVAEGVWMTGVIDEIRMGVEGTDRNPILVDTKTRVKDTLPSEPQRRNGRLQLMCYKYLWDNLVADNFLTRQFFDFFSLNPHHILSEEIRANTATAGFPSKTLDDMVRYYRSTFSMLSPAHNQLLLRYEFQKDESMLAEIQFAYDSDWLKSQIQESLEFWHGEREARYAPVDEHWKCHYCQFAAVCPSNTDPHNTLSLSKTNDNGTQR